MTEDVKKLKRAVIKEEFIAITGNFIDAVILNQFIYWTERVKDFDSYIQQENERAIKSGFTTQDLTNGWIYKTSEELSGETMLGLSPASMRAHIKALEYLDFIDERTNPKYKWDRTIQYRVNLINVVKSLHENGYELDGYQPRINKNAILETNNGRSKTENRCKSNSKAIPETTPQTTVETPKKERKTSFDDAISEYTSNDELKETIIDFIKMRKLIKAPMTDRALKGIFKELDKLGHSDAEKIAILEQSIQRSWRGVFAINKPNQEPKREEKHEMTIEEWAGDKLLPV